MSITFNFCEIEGCTLPGYEFSYTDGEKPSYYCGGHAHEQGFCVGCGGFFGGVESSDCSRSGLCDQCEDELGDEDDDDDWLDDIDL